MCCFQLTAPNKKRQCVSRTIPMVSSQCVSRYSDLFTTETKELSCYMTTFPLVFFAWPMIQSGYEMDDSNFFRCGLRGVLKWWSLCTLYIEDIPLVEFMYLVY